jgi:hypothetical protein
MLHLRLILAEALTLTRAAVAVVGAAAVVAPLAAVAAVAVVATIAQAMTTRQTFKPASLLLLRPFLPTMRLVLMRLQLCIRMRYARAGPLL